METSEFLQGLGLWATIGAVAVVFGLAAFFIKCWKKVVQGKAIIRTGFGKARVSFSGIMVIPVIHRMEIIDISVKRIEIHRLGEDGLICKDNLRADIKVAFFVGINNTEEDVLKVAQYLGVHKGSDPAALIEFFDAKFSEALKTVGKRFDFVDLYNSREKFKLDILEVIGTDLNGYFLDDAAIDYLEQTSVQNLNPKNILDAQGIKKITELTAAQNMLANDIRNEEEKTIKRQNVEAREAILEMERQLAEAEEKQKREVASATAREEAETKKIQEEERLKSERARINTEEEVKIAEENKDRQIVVAAKAKERTDAVETERVKRDQQLEATERERAVAIAGIEKEKAVEEEKKNIQHIIKERVIVEKTVVVEEEKIKDTRVWAEAERVKKAAVINAEQIAQEKLVKDVKSAEASKLAMDEKAKERLVEANADKDAAELKALAMKSLAEGQAQEEAVLGMSEVKVMEAKADAVQKEGFAEAAVIEKKALAEAVGTKEKALAEAAGNKEKGLVEAEVLRKKYNSEAEGITEKAEAMKIFDLAGKDHEEFKLKLDKQLKVDLAEIDMQRKLAESQARVIQEGLKTAKIDIVGGESTFFNQIATAITNGKKVDRIVGNSKVLTDVKDTFINGDQDYFKTQLSKFLKQFPFTTEDIKNLSLAKLLHKMIDESRDENVKSKFQDLLAMVKNLNIGGKNSGKFLGLV